jgi:hypothetical protein
MKRNLPQTYLKSYHWVLLFKHGNIYPKLLHCSCMTQCLSITPPPKKNLRLSLNKWDYAVQFTAPIFSKCVLCDSTFLTGIEVHLFYVHRNNARHKERRTLPFTAAINSKLITLRRGENLFVYFMK